MWAWVRELGRELWAVRIGYQLPIALKADWSLAQVKRRKMTGFPASQCEGGSHLQVTGEEKGG